MSPRIDLVGAGRFEEFVNGMKTRLAGVGLGDEAIFEAAWNLATALAPRTLEPATSWVEFLVDSVLYRVDAKSRYRP